MDWWHNWQRLTKEELDENINKEYKVLKLMFWAHGNDPDTNFKIIIHSKKKWVERDPTYILWEFIADKLEKDFECVD